MNVINTLTGFFSFDKNTVSPILLAVAIIATVLGTGLLINFIVFKILAGLVHKKNPILEKYIKKLLRPLGRFFFPLVLFFLLIPLIPLSPEITSTLRHFISIFIILSFGWILIKLLQVIKRFMLEKYPISGENNLKARKVQTQFTILQRILSFIIFVIIGASVLMTFKPVRDFGMSLLASAGIISIIAGFAAQKSISTIIAGIQIAITQPIRIDDVLIVEGEWGKVEELTLTYVVLRIWDSRRLVIPINYFIEKPFQNWTRVSSDLLGTVFLYTDYTLPLEPLREKLNEILNSTPLWDRRVGIIQVTGTTETTMEIRILVSAQDAGLLYDLRCFVREQMIRFVRDNYPGSLPQKRVNLKESTEK